MARSSFRMIARSVGYRMGKQEKGNAPVSPNFSELFTPEYVADAEAGYTEGRQFMQAKREGRYVDTFYQGRIHP